jgi:DNA-directed RNA polymerase subunit RPC12/RpoP
MFDETFEIQNENLKCVRCSQVFDEKQMVASIRMGGCLPVTLYQCFPCSEKSDLEDKARKYQVKHFCSRCKEKFKRPYFRNRKHLSTGSRGGYWINSYCLACYEIEKERFPKEPQKFHPWLDGKSTPANMDADGLW